ncbi:MAG: hypothetical protein IKP28_01125 [Clostridia bacterium]|nr:hypothetical protein [Clostridia bacterium]
MNSCEFVTLISTIACAIAKDKSQDEIAIIAAFFTQLRRYTYNYFHM